MGEILSAPEGRCEGQIGEDDTRQWPARGLPTAGGSAVLAGPRPRSEHPLGAQPQRGGPCLDSSQQAGSGLWAHTGGGAGRRPPHADRWKSKCERLQGPAATSALRALPPGPTRCRGQRSWGPSAAALTSCVTCSSGLGLLVRVRNHGPPRGHRGATPESQVPSTRRAVGALGEAVALPLPAPPLPGSRTPSGVAPWGRSP